MNIMQLFGASMGADLPVQYLRPDGDYAAAGLNWQPNGAGTLYECTDDVTPDEDATYAGNDDVQGYWFPTMSNPRAQPRADQLHKLVIRARWLGTVVTGTPDLRVQIYSPGLVSVLPHKDLTQSWADYEWELSESEIANITDYDQMRLSVQILAYLPGSTSYEGRITQAYFQIGELP